MVGIVSGNSLGLGNTSLATLGQRAAQGNASQGRGGEQVYVNIATGNLVIANSDDQLIAHGGSFQAVRTYNSQGLLNDDNADNWSAGFYRRQLVLSGSYGQVGSSLTRIERDGASTVFSWDAASGSYFSTDGVGAYDRIVLQGASYVFTDGATYSREFYDTVSGRLDKSVDAGGNTTAYTYDANGNIARLLNPSGESIQYDYTDNLLTRIRVVDSQGATTTRTSYTYDARNRLSQVIVDLTPQDGSTADGKLYRTSYTYHGDSNRIATLTQSDGTQLTIDYVQVGSEFKVSSLRDALGQTTRFAYDAATRTTQVTDAAGKVYGYAYDTKGQLLSITSPATNGVAAVQRFEYNANGDLVRATDPDGRTVFMAYDANGNQVLQRDGAGNTVTRTYNTSNRLLSETVYTQPDPDGDGVAQASGAQTTRYVYDDATGMQLRFAISAEGRVTEYRRNAYGEVVSMLRHQEARYAPAGAVGEAALSAWAGQQNLRQLQRTDYMLDFRGQAQTTTTYAATDASGNGLAAGSTVTRHIYDQAGRLLQTIDGNGGTTSYAYDGLGRLLTVTDAKGQITTTTYDDAGRRIAVLSANGLRETRSYDSAGRLISNLREDTASAAASSTTSFGYDATGRLVSTQDATGIRQWNVYDAAGRKVAGVDGSGAATEYRYNASGQLVQTIAYAKALPATADAPTLQSIQALAGAGDQKSWRVYDDAQRLVWQIGPQGEATRTDYDGASLIIAVTQLATPVALESLDDGSRLVARGSSILTMGSGSSLALAIQAIPAKAAAGEPVRIVATGVGLDKGNIVFKSGATVLGTVRAVNGAAEITLSSLPAGTQDISATYVSEAGQAQASTQPLSLLVQQRSETALKAPSAATNVPGRVTLTAQVNGHAPQGTVAFFRGDTLLGVATVSAGIATLEFDASTAQLLAGTNEISARYSGDATHMASTALATMQVVHSATAAPANRSEPTLNGLSVSPKLAITRQSSNASPTQVSFSVAVQGGTPAGAVTFSIGDTVIGHAPVINGVAQLSAAIPLLASGTYNVTASYSGDSAFQAASVTENAFLTIRQLSPQATVFNSLSGNYGSRTAVVASLLGPFVPTGQVDFYSNGQLIGSATLDSYGYARLDLSGLLTNAGSHRITARYAGDANNTASVSSEYTIDTLASPQVIQVSASTDNLTQGEPLDLTARVGVDTSDGYVTFYADGQVLGVAAVSAGVARLTSTGLRNTGNIQITASYTGNATQTSSVRSGNVLINVAPAQQPMPPVAPGSPTSTALTASGSLLGTENIQLTATVGSTEGTATGTVSFYDGSVLVGTATVVNGKARLTLSSTVRTGYGSSGSTALYTPAEGARTLRAIYSGDATHAASETSTAKTLEKGFLPDGELAIVRRRGGYELTFTSFHTDGPVTFYSDGVAVGTAAIVNGRAQLMRIPLPAGNHDITVEYPGNALYRAGLIGKTARNYVDVAVSAPPTTPAGAATTLLVTLAGVSSDATGTVSLFDNGRLIGSAQVLQGGATLILPANLLSAGAHQLNITYSGDSNHLSGNGLVRLEVTAAPADTRMPSQLSLVAEPAGGYGDPMAVQVSDPGATGKVSVFSGTTLLGEYLVANGKAQVPASILPAGTQTIRFIYSGDAARHASEVSAQFTGPRPDTAVQAVLGMRTEGRQLHLQASVPAGGAGTFRFMRNGVLLQAVAAVNGAASLQLGLSSLADGEFWVEYSDPASSLSGTSLHVTRSALSTSPTMPAISTADRVTRQFHDADGLLLATLDAAGYLVSLTYDGAGRLASTTRFANATAPAQRATGTLPQLLPAANNQDIVERRLYDGQGRLTATVDGAGYLTTFEYDAAGLPTRQTRYATALAATVLSTLTSTTPVASIRPPANAQDRSSTLEYDKLGRLAAETDHQGTRTEHSYDAAGNRTASTVAAGTSEARTRQARYDALGRITAELSAEGARQLATAQTPAQIEAVWSSYASRHTYDAAGRRTSTIDANGLRTLFFYNAESRLTHTVNALGEVTETRYNALGQVSAQVRYGTRINPGTLTGSLAGGLIHSTLQSLLQAAANVAKDQATEYTYNANGTLASVRDALGFTKNYVYNSFREETQRLEATGTGTTSTLIQTSYDRRGLVTDQVRDAGKLALFTAATYDAFGRQISSRDALGNIRTRAYDRLGREVGSTDAMWATLTTTYDAFSRIVTQVNAEGGTTRYAYDAQARSITITTDEGLLARQTYNRHGDQISASDSQGNLTSYTFDANGQPTGSSASAWLYDAKVMQTAATANIYDKAGRLVETVDANGTRTTIAYDAANRVLARTVDPTGLALTTQYAYDPLGRQIRVTAPGGTVTELRYDAKGQLLEQLVDPEGLALSTRYSYDAQGQALEVTSPEGTLTRYTYDAAGRRTREQIDPSGLNLTRSYTYDANGNVTSSLDANGNTSYYLYDRENRQVLAIDGAGGIQETRYDALGRISRLARYRNPLTGIDLQAYANNGPSFGPATWPEQVRARIVTSANDTIEYRSYDANNHLQSVVTGQGEVTTYLRDGNGRIQEQRSYANRISLGAGGWTPGTFPTPVADDGKDLRTRMVYDSMGRLIATADGAGSVTGLRYDAAGNVVQRVRYAQAITLGSAPYDSSAIYALIAQDGSAANAVEQNTYDRAGRLTWTADAAGSVTAWQYDRDGRIVKQARFASAIAAGQQPQDAAQAGALATDYVYDAAGRQTYIVGADGAVVRQVWDRNGNLRRRTEFATTITPPIFVSGAVMGPIVTNYDRSSIGAVLRSTLNDRSVALVYDKANRQVLEISATGAVRQIRYDRPITVAAASSGASGSAQQPWHSQTVTAYANTVQLSGMNSAADITLERVMALLQTNASQDRETTQILDGAGRTVRTIDANGYTTAREYDGTGQLTHLIEYADKSGAPSAQDRHTRYSYDGAGRLTRSTDALGNSESFSYNALGQKTVFTNKAGATWNYDYDAAGRLVRETSPAVDLVAVRPQGNALVPDTGNTGSQRIVTQLAYDAFGNLSSRTEALGRPEQRTTRYEYDKVGRQIKTIFPGVGVYQGESSTALRDNQRLGDAARVEANNIELSSETRYDALGNAVASRAMGIPGAKEAWSYKSYDRAGRVSFDVDAAGYVTGYTRNAWGETERLVRHALAIALPSPAGTALADAAVRQGVQANHPANREILTSYDKMGRTLTVQEPQVFNYDSQTGETASGRKSTTHAYNAFGDLASTTVNLGNERTAVTSHGYDKLGRRVATTDALGFITTLAYDAMGNLVRQVEYAKAGTMAAITGTPYTEAGDRVTDYGYDLLGRKIKETRRGVAHTGVNAAAQEQKDVLYDKTSDLTTQFSYDALGNLTCTTDALGGTTYHFYDVLGRVRATITPAVNLGVATTGAGANPVNPLTEFQRDAHGNVLITTQYATGAKVAADGQGYTKAASGNDRVTYAKFDAQGHTAQITDAQGNSRYYAYDAQGRLAKEWQTVTSYDKSGNPSQASLWRAYAYDVLGRQTHSYAPSESIALGTLSVSDTELSYNAFGEVTQKRVLDNGQALQGVETYDYDNAGRVWRTNAGDGVYKILAYDLQGRQTAQLVSEGLDLKTTYQDTQGALNAQAANKAQWRRTDMRYDALGRLVQTLAPERATEQPMTITTRQNMLYGVITQSEVDIQQVPADYQRNRYNQVDLVWRSLEDLGSGDVRITLTYDTRAFTQTNPDGDSYNVTSLRNQTKTVIVPAEAAVEGYSLKWVNESKDAPGIGAVQKVLVEKMDVFGKWVSIYDVANTQPYQTSPLNWTTAPSPGFLWNEAGDGRIPIYRYYNRDTDTHFFSTSLAERERLLNQANGWLDEGITGYVSKDPKPGWVPLYRWTKVGAPEMSQYTNGAMPTGGSWQSQGIEGYVASPSLSDTEAGKQGLTRLYRLKNNGSALGNGIYTTSESDRNALLGLRTISDEQSNARSVQMFGASRGLSIEVSYPQDLVSKTALEYRRYGSTDAWTTAPTSIQTSFGSAHRFDVAALGLPPANYEYRVRNTNAQMTRDVGSGTFSTAPDNASGNLPPLPGGVNQGNAMIDGSAYRVLQWPKPAAGWNVEFRYWPQGNNSAVTTRTAGNGLFAYGDGRTSGMGIGMQGVAVNWGAGNIEYEVIATNTATGEKLRSTGQVGTPSGLSMQNTPVRMATQNNNVTNLGVVGYVWNSPGPGRTPLYRFYFPYQSNDHHITTADPKVIAEFQALMASGAVTSDGIVGYVGTSPIVNGTRLYQYIYGGKSVFRITARPQDMGSYTSLTSKPAAGFQWSPTTWYQNTYQFDGYISNVPADGMVPLYAVYDGNSFGNQGIGDYLTSTLEHEITANYLLDTDSAATAQVPGVGTSQANIDGQTYNVLRWNTPDSNARVKVRSSPPLPGGTPTLWRQGDGRSQFQNGAALQGIVLDALYPNTKYTITIEIEYPATWAKGAYIARSDVTITVPSSGASSAIRLQDTTPPYTETVQTRAWAGTPFNLSNRAVTNREYDRWGNLTQVDDPRVQAGQSLFKTRFTYNASNQIISQTQLASYEGPTEYATTRIYYDALGRQVGVRDANGNVNAQVRDLAGNVVQERKADGGRIDLSYNAFGDKISAAERMTDTRTVVTNYRYDQLSRLTQTELGRAISRFEVQAMGSQITQGAGKGADHGANGVTLTGPIDYTLLETVQYDEAGRKVRVINGNNEATRYRYDLVGNVTMSGQELARAAHTPGQPGSPVQLGALDNVSYYRYDALGRKIGFTDASAMSQDWRYDLFGRLTERNDDQMRGAARVKYQYTYNQAGQLTHEGSSAGKSLDYRYDGAGQLIEIKDNYLGQLSSYTYDLAGNRLTEKLTQKTRLASGVIENVVYQDNHLFYDAQNRLRASFDGRTDVRISYDLAGNRSQVKTSVINNLYTIKNEGKTYQSPGQYQQFVNESVTTYSYDAMNRQLSSREYQGATPNGTLLKSHDYRYDQAGNRIQDTVFEKSTTAGVDDTRGTYQYVYDDLNRVESYTGYGLAERTDSIRYDGAGRQVYAMSLARSNNLWNDEHRYNQYDALGRLQDTRVVMRRTDNQQKTQHTDIAYHGAAGDTSLGYDGAGYLRGTVQTTDGRTNDAVRTTYQYQFNGGYQQTSSTTTQGGQTATTNTWRDANGFISNIEQQDGVVDNRYNRAFVNDARGNALYVNQSAGSASDKGGRIENRPGGYIGGFIGDAFNPGHIQRQLVANGEVLARYGDAPDSENRPQGGAVPKYVNTAEFHLDAAPLKLRDSSFSAINYTVVGGETLKTIARTVLGDSSLWWRIAEANGLAISGDGELKAGQTLSIPKLALNANNADTFQPYDPSRVTGSLDSVLPAPAAQGGGCGGLGKIIMVAVAVVAAVYTAGALAPAAAGASTGFSATMSAGMSVLGGSAGLSGTTVAIGAASGAAGSIASQAAGNLLGVQDGFSWKGVALSALSGGISSGLAGTPLFAGSNLDKLLLRSTVGNALTQGVGVVTGLQSSFSWRGVAASAAGAVAGQVAGKLLGDVVDSTSWDPWAKEMVTRTGSGLAAGAAASIAQGGRISMQQVATDAFGNALGWSIAGASLPTPGASLPTPKDPAAYDWPDFAARNRESMRRSFKVAGLGSIEWPTLVVRPTGSEWANPFADSRLASAHWTISSITSTARSSPQEAGWSFREASMAQRKLDDAQALAQYRARLANGPSMSAWDGVARQSPINTYLTQARGGLDAVRGEQWHMRVAQSLPDAVVNEVGGLAAAKVIGMLSKAAAPVRGAIFGERSVLMSNLQTEMRAGLRADLPIGPSLEGIRPGGSAAGFGNTGRIGAADYLSRFSSTELDALRIAGLSDVEIARHVQLSGDVYLFRGTSPGWVGSPGAQATAVSATTDPYIATVFALEARGQAGQAVIQFGPRSSIGTFDVGNWMAAQEREVGVLMTSRDFAARAPSSVPVDTARQVLGEMGMPALPHTVASPSARSMLLDAAPKMTPDQVFEFLQLVNKMGQR